MEHKITEVMRQQLCAPLPPEAVSPHPTKKFLSCIKSIYVTERLNEVFGVGAWRVKTDIVDRNDKMIVCKVTFTVPEYDIEYECFGGNDNPDLGDAYKGATTDALTKIASWLGIGAEVFRGESGKVETKAQTKRERTRLTTDALMDDTFAGQVCDWLHGKYQSRKNMSSTIADIINYYYECDEETFNNLLKEYYRKYPK